MVEVLLGPLTPLCAEPSTTVAWCRKAAWPVLPHVLRVAHTACGCLNPYQGGAAVQSDCMIDLISFPSTLHGGMLF